VSLMSSYRSAAVRRKKSGAKNGREPRCDAAAHQTSDAFIVVRLARCRKSATETLKSSNSY